MLTLCVSAPVAVSANMAGTNDTINTHIDKNLLNHLDLGLTAGTTGIGIGVSAPLGQRMRLRAGFDFMPRTNVPLRFELMSYTPGSLHASTDIENFNKLSSLMESFTGIQIDQYIDTHAKGTMWNAKLLVDLYPLRNNRHWYVTAGFYWGTSKVGHAENTIQEAPSVVGVFMYNKLYDFFATERYLDEPFPMVGLLTGGSAEAFIDPEVGDVVRDKFIEYGRLGAKNGYFCSGPFAGQPYMLTPDENGIVYADLFVNNFKPYLGLGYNTHLSKDRRWNLSVDGGVLFWGRPRALTHERYYYDADGKLAGYGVIPESEADKNYTYGSRIDLANDVERVVGKLGDYVDICRTMRVYPVLNLKISYKLF